MLRDDFYQQCVTFLYALVPDPNRPGRTMWEAQGTAVGVGLLEGQLFFPYALTARHIVEMARAHGRSPLHFRVTKDDGTSEYFPVPDDSWVLHPRTDLAVADYVHGAGSDIAFLDGEEQLVRDDDLDRIGIGLGTPIFFVGMFSEHPGRKRNLPVVRFGNISLMREEPVRIATDDQGSTALIDAYLVEARSLGGHSGSPAFVKVKTGWHVHPALLGLVQGHFEASRSDPALFGDLERPPQDNAGMAVVIPATYIGEMLYMDELKERREKEAREFAKHEPAARPDSSGNATHAMTKSEFDEALARATRKVQPERRRERGRH